jgi:hypothetical protein
MMLLQHKNVQDVNQQTQSFATTTTTIFHNHAIFAKLVAVIGLEEVHLEMFRLEEVVEGIINEAKEIQYQNQLQNLIVMIIARSVLVLVLVVLAQQVQILLPIMVALILM